MSLQSFFQKYTGFLRSLKAVYVVNNLLQSDRLRHNRSLYRKYGLQKSIFSPVGSGDFKTHHPDIPWIDRPDALEKLEQNAEFQALGPVLQEKVRGFLKDGYMILEGFFPEADTDALNGEVAAQLEAGKAQYNYTGRKIFNFFGHSRLADERFFRNPELLRLLSFLLGKKVIPFQSLNFTLGSEQRAHSDSIHMTTEPPGYLIATWIALEDCTPENGALFYYPGSHRLPYLTTTDYPSGNTRWTIGNNSNRRYEDKIEEVIAETGLQKQPFLGKRGDVLIWHANLLHGGSPITRPGATRRSMVCHYYAEDVICYHEMSQRPALLPPTHPV
ncbi:MAG: phytanoyl-CoA dioxygenase family protein [Saprospiraceae bacterium]|nr:phytanoyl-CoA dioxygenase family protein [Saprospiraceae bacterium]MCB0542255.1 phytanoyl-CoA dioxygenase family protein [Saprospiraceae bacterium]MCB0573138.1 phytanoyl-CoA dioxygenase family protein [Saprospiraceae bacterium]